MRHDASFGIIPLKWKQHAWQVLLVQHQAGHWAFPKGHAEPGETPQKTAERELKEETGLSVESYLSQQTLLEQYLFTSKGELISKKVTYFLASVKGQVVIQQEEIQASEWMPISEAINKISFKEGKALCLQAQNILNQI